MDKAGTCPVWTLIMMSFDCQGWGNGSVDRVLALQASGPELDP